MWRRVDIVLTDISVEGIVSIFRVEEKENLRARNQLSAPAHAGSSLADFFFLYPKDGGDTFLRNVG
jgi:hypothetical protein